MVLKMIKAWSSAHGAMVSGTSSGYWGCVCRKCCGSPLFLSYSCMKYCHPSPQNYKTVMVWNLPNYEPNTTLSPCSAGCWSQCLAHTRQTLQHCFISSNLDSVCVCGCVCLRARMCVCVGGERWPQSLWTFSLYKLITLGTYHSNEKMTSAPSGKFNLRSRSCKQKSIARNMINTKL